MRVFGGPVEVDTAMLTGATVLVGVGVAVAGAGALLGWWSVLKSARRWARGVEQSPIELATAHWPRAKAAVRAGYGTWQTSPPSSSQS